MENLKPLLLAALQGLSEFLPVSSSGHTLLAESFLSVSEKTLFFSVLLHFGSFFAILCFYKKELFKSLEESFFKKIFLRLVIASLPAFFLFIFFRDFLETQFESTNVLKWSFLVSAFFVGSLFFKKKQLYKQNLNLREISELSFFKTFLVGVAQGLALIPGVSRSGTTISSAVYLGLSGTSAAFFSFLMALVAIFGAVFFELLKKAGFSFFFLSFFIFL